MKLLRKVARKIKSIGSSVLISFYYFWFKRFVKKPSILSFEETIELIKNKKMCVARYGDGEMKLMLNKAQIGFQSLNSSLSKELFLCFKTKKPNLLVCYHDIPLTFPKKSIEYKFYKQYLYDIYRPCLKLIDKHYFYGNTNFTRFYHPSLFAQTDFEKLEKYIVFLKSLWEGKKLLIVEGSETKLGLGNDLFDNCLSIRRIICPKVNAYDKIDRIFESITSNAQSDELVLIALGPTASILSTRLAVNTDIQAIDIGHIDIVYLWFINRCDTVCRISGKYVNEAKKDAAVINLTYDEGIYNKQIIARIN